MLHRLSAAGFDVATRNHAAAILGVDFPAETASSTGGLSAALAGLFAVASSPSGWLAWSRAPESDAGGVVSPSCSIWPAGSPGRIRASRAAPSLDSPGR